MVKKLKIAYSKTSTETDKGDKFYSISAHTNGESITMPLTPNQLAWRIQSRPRNRSSRAKRSIHGNLCPTRRSTRLSSNLSTRLNSAQLVSTVIDSTDLAVTLKGRESGGGATPEGSNGGARGQYLRRRVNSCVHRQERDLHDAQPHAVAGSAS